jgi:DNA-binding response OmpR family regulator
MKRNVKILIVEDDIFIAEDIESQVMEIGYENIMIATTYDEAMKSIRNEIPDLILLDIDLQSEKTGIDIANDDRVFNQIPVIYLTDYTDSRIQESMRETNPITCLSKPFKYEDLRYTVNSVLSLKVGTINLGHEFSYDLENQNLFLKKQFIRLTSKERDLLERLIESKGNPVESRVLELTIWDKKIAGNALRNLVTNLRKKLNDKDNKRIIVTVPSFGYKLPLPKDRT